MATPASFILTPRQPNIADPVAASLNAYVTPCYGLVPERCCYRPARYRRGLEDCIAIDFGLDHHLPGVRRSASGPGGVQELQAFERNEQGGKARQIAAQQKQYARV